MSANLLAPTMKCLQAENLRAPEASVKDIKDFTSSFMGLMPALWSKFMNSTISSTMIILCPDRLASDNAQSPSTWAIPFSKYSGPNNVSNSGWPTHPFAGVFPE